MKHVTYNTPLVSIILPVHNGARYIEHALDSIIAQTYRHWKLIVVNDGSTDETGQILSDYAKKDSRINIVTMKKPRGISKALNRGVKQAKGLYIARMDADDISYPKRLEKQVKYLQKHQYVVAVGTQCDIIDADGRVTGVKMFPVKSQDIYNTVFRFNPLQHPTLMIDRTLLPKGFVFYDDLDGAEDLNLLFKLFPYGKVENLRDHLLAYRIHGENSSLKHIKKIYMQALTARIRGVLRHGYVPSAKSVCLTIAQTLIIAILPERVIRPLYFYARGIKASISTKAKQGIKILPAFLRG